MKSYFTTSEEKLEFLVFLNTLYGAYAIEKGKGLRELNFYYLRTSLSSKRHILEKQFLFTWIMKPNFSN